MEPEWVPVLMLVAGAGANCPSRVMGMESQTSLFVRIWLSILIQACTHFLNMSGKVIWYERAFLSSPLGPSLKNEIRVHSLKPKIVPRGTNTAW